MSCVAIVTLSHIRLIALLFALCAITSIEAAPLRNKPSDGVNNLPARSVTDALPRATEPSLSEVIARGLAMHVRALSLTKQPAADELDSIFPVDGAKEKWTTAKGAPGSLPLSDSTLNIVRASGPKYTYSEYEGKKALVATYPKGSYRPGATDAPKGGISIYLKGPKNVDLTTAKEATFGYAVYFPEGFAWVKGGKLPGLYGGDDPQVSMSCSGGRRDTRCFSARLMWRPGGKGEMYTYLPPYDMKGFEANKKQCSVPNSDCNPTYGTSLNRGSFNFKTGAWTTVSERVKLNTPGKADGELELFVEGKSVIKVDGVIIRDDAKGRIRGVQMESFFGGHTEDWATPKGQKVYFADLSVAITETLSE